MFRVRLTICVFFLLMRLVALILYLPLARITNTHTEKERERESEREVGTHTLAYQHCCNIIFHAKIISIRRHCCFWLPSGIANMSRHNKIKTAKEIVKNFGNQCEEQD